MRRTEQALAAWREAGRELDRAAEALLRKPESNEAQAAYEAAVEREAAARAEYQANVARVTREQASA